MAAKSEDRVLAVIVHILGLFFWFLGPLVVLLVSKSNYVKKNARAALNWQLSRIVYSLISIVLIIIFVGLFMLVALSIANVVFCIIAAVKAGEGTSWRYPLTIRFLK